MIEESNCIIELSITRMITTDEDPEPVSSPGGWTLTSTLHQVLKTPGGSCRVLQSPLAGVSDRVFRRLVRRWAPDALLFTEMVNATSLERGHGRRKVEELTKEKQFPILVSDETRLRSGEAFRWQRVDQVPIRGREQPVALYYPGVESKTESP